MWLGKAPVLLHSHRPGGTSNGPDIPLSSKKIEALCLHFLTSDDISFFIGYIHGNLLLSGGGNCRELSGSRSQMW